jgi:pyroglutamyl-peptidase
VTLLLTAFNPFGGGRRNISEELVRAVETSWRPAHAKMVVAVLPTEYGLASRLIVELIAEHRPRWLVSCGLAEDEPCIRFELVARNADTCPAEDNAAVCRDGSAIVAGGPAEYEATLPYPLFGRELSLRGIPYRYSDDAGGFVCNHVFYTAAHAIGQFGLQTQCGFIHWPPDTPSVRHRGVSFEVSLEALRLCLGAVSEQTQSVSDRNSVGTEPRRSTLLPPGWTLALVRDEETLRDVIALDGESFTMPWRPEMFVAAAQSAQMRLLVLRAPGDPEIAGYVCYGVKGAVEIATLAVRRDRRRTGLGTLLVETALADGAAQHASHASLHVRVSNVAGRRLYEDLEFLPVAIRTDYYHDPIEDALVYQRRLTGARQALSVTRTSTRSD